MIRLQDPRTLELSGTTKQLLAQVTEAMEAVADHRPFTVEIGSRIRNALLPDRIVASLNMEGIVATRRQTLEVMDAMRVSENVGRGKQEILNALKADEFIHDCVDQGLSLTERTIREVNALLMYDVRDDAGTYRNGPVELPGAPFEPPLHIDVPALVEKLVDMFTLGDSVHPIIQAAWLHAQLTLIHPFFDGNGRTGRLLQDCVLLRRGFLPIGIPPSERDDYYSALEKADKGSWDAVVEMLADLELKIIAKAEAAARAPERRLAWISKLSEAASRKATNTQHKRYLVWRRQMEQINQGFAEACRELDAASTIIGAECKEFGVMDFASWRRTCQVGYVPRNWLFSMLFYAEGRPFYKTVAVQQRHAHRPELPFNPENDQVALYFTGVAADSFARPEYQNYTDPHVRLREIVFDDGQMRVLTEVDPEIGWKCESNSTLEPTIETFFGDMFGRKAGLAV